MQLILSWIKDAPYKGKSVDKDNNALNGYFLAEQKKKNFVKVYSNGHLMTCYKFPKIKIPFKSKMHSWENLSFCGYVVMKRIFVKILLLL
ncbi:hypothetical protein ACFVRR_12325 [Gottfriedia sp. NPDC057948]|uniref:hypothetical protein n=1 Tax=Gottfriedia sp. NPDC057948 TaxID=3346287 RepID=UPI0036DD2525